jgi:hypothetical protein
MTNEERDIIAQFIQRVSGAQAAQAPSAFGGGGSVPAAAPALPPVDREADNYIGQLFQQYPDARYRLTQTAFVQEHALVEAQNRIKRLEWELDQTRQALQQAQAQAQQGSKSSGGFLGGLFGGGSQNRAAPPQGAPVWNQGAAPPQYAPQAAPPPPQYPPNYQPGMLPRQGSGFLGSALTTAAGVAGGLVVGNALMDMFSPHQAFGGGMGGGFGGAIGGGSPWGAPVGVPEPPLPPPDTGYVDQGTWTTPDPDPSGGGQDASWSDPGGDPGGSAGWDTGGGSDDDNF